MESVNGYQQHVADMAVPWLVSRAGRCRRSRPAQASGINARRNTAGYGALGSERS
jgi:hypothetical protein